MHIAFYAPLKPVDHPVPSGDRLMARAFVALLEGLGHQVGIASRLRSFERDGDPEQQQRLRSAADAEVERLLGGSPRYDLWFTYHAYHKAPDWLGPALSERLSIPYVVAEASIAGKRAGGPWAAGHAATIAAVNAADAVLAMTRVDARNLTKYLHDTSTLEVFPPFVARPWTFDRQCERARLAAEWSLAADLPWLVTVAMMRPDVKLRSYRLLADCLSRLEGRAWHLLVVGDGAAGADVRNLLTAAAGDRVRFLGECAPEQVASVLSAADVFVWPALKEAYCMAILEALAVGLPVVACSEGGVADLVEHGWNGLLARDRSPTALAGHVACLLAQGDLRSRMGQRAARRVAERHSRDAASARLDLILKQAGARRRARRCV